LPAFDRKINGAADVAANAVNVITGIKPAQFDFVLRVADSDQISIGVEQFKNERLIAVILIHLRVKQRIADAERNFDKILSRVDRAGVTLFELALVLLRNG